MQINFIKLNPQATTPTYATANSVGADLYACLQNPITLQPMQTALVSTGIAIELPLQVEAQIRPRSGLAINSGITVLNAPGTIDSDYRGEIKVILINLSNNSFIINHNTKIAQMVFANYITASFNMVNSISATARGSNGFGSSGV